MPRQRDPARRRSGPEPDGLRLRRATPDALALVWPAVSAVRSWRVVCWDGRDSTVALLNLTGKHRRATFAGLARLQQPFTIAVSGLNADGTVVWQDGLADLRLRESGQVRKETITATKAERAAEKAVVTRKPPPKKTSRGK
jgi:hypothetical protein